MYVEKGCPDKAGVQLPDSHALPVTTWPKPCPCYMLYYFLYGVKGVTILLLSAREVKGPWLMGMAYSREKGDITTHITTIFEITEAEQKLKFGPQTRNLRRQMD